MRWITGFAVLLLIACAPGDPETHTTSADVDLESVPAMLAAIDEITDDRLPVESLVALANKVGMDQEEQERLTVSFGGEQTELLFHVWREQADWVHVYASSPSAPLIDTVEQTLKTYERPAEP